MRNCWKYLARNKNIAAKNIIRVTAHGYRINLNILQSSLLATLSNIRLFLKNVNVLCPNVLSLNGTLVERTGELKCPNMMYC